MSQYTKLKESLTVRCVTTSSIIFTIKQNLLFYINLRTSATKTESSLTKFIFEKYMSDFEDFV